MKHAHDILRARLHARIDAHGKPPARAVPKITPEQLDGQWHAQFELLMRNRLKMGALRYGLNFCNAAGKPQYDRTQSAIKRLELYRETGNDELLVDVALKLPSSVCSRRRPFQTVPRSARSTSLMIYTGKTAAGI